MARFVALVAIFSLVIVFALASSRVFPEGSDSLSLGKGWAIRRSERFDKSTEQREFIVAIKQQNLQALEELFWAVSDPTSPQYGQFVTIDQLTDLIAPTNEAISTVTEFLVEHGATDLQLTMNRDFVRARASFAALERMFNVTFSTYRHRDAFDVAVRGTLDAYSLPAEVAEHVDIVSHIVGLPDVHLPRKAKFAAAGDLDITPSVIWARYNISGWTAKSASNSQAVAEFQAQFYSQTDLSTFFQKFVPNSKADTVYKVVGTNNPAKPGDEASLDIQYLMGVAPNISTWFYSQAQFNFYNDLVNWLTILSNQTDAPWVHSVSYGSQGNYPSATYQSRSDAEYQKLGARGLTIVYASGDSGAQCEDRCKTLEASYPAISTYVTSIGSTKFINGNTGPEAATTAFKSGGGFSNYNARPSYQSTAVQTYLNLNTISFPPSGSFNATGRGTPDFAALGDEHFQVIVGGRTFSIGGTSASAPTFAAVVSILNDYRLAAGKSTLGFVNPLFYQLAAQGNGAFYDITIGDNKEGCGTSCAPKINGFMCAPGWDAVTGYGTPNVNVLKTQV